MKRREIKNKRNMEMLKTEVNAHKTTRFCNGCMSAICGSIAVMVITTAVDSVKGVYDKYQKNKKSDETIETK